MKTADFFWPKHKDQEARVFQEDQAVVTFGLIFTRDLSRHVRLSQSQTAVKQCIKKAGNGVYLKFV